MYNLPTYMVVVDLDRHAVINRSFAVIIDKRLALIRVSFFKTIGYNFYLWYVNSFFSSGLFMIEDAVSAGAEQTITRR